MHNRARARYVSRARFRRFAINNILKFNTLYKIQKICILSIDKIQKLLYGVIKGYLARARKPNLKNVGGIKL